MPHWLMDDAPDEAHGRMALDEADPFADDSASDALEKDGFTY